MSDTVINVSVPYVVEFIRRKCRTVESGISGKTGRGNPNGAGRAGPRRMLRLSRRKLLHVGIFSAVVRR